MYLSHRSRSPDLPVMHIKRDYVVLPGVMYTPAYVILVMIMLIYSD